MEKQLEIIRHHTNHGGQPLGDLLWWELAAASVSRPDLTKLWVQGGLPTELLPEPPTPEKAFKTAAKEAQVGHPDRLLRLAVENELEVVFGIVSEKRDGIGGLEYQQEARVTLSRQSDSVRSDQPGDTMVQKLVVRFDELKTLHTTDDIRRTITKTLDSFAAVTLRQTGGVYWVPAPYAAPLRRLQGVIEQLGTVQDAPGSDHSHERRPGRARSGGEGQHRRRTGGAANRDAAVPADATRPSINAHAQAGAFR